MSPSSGITTGLTGREALRGRGVEQRLRLGLEIGGRNLALQQRAHLRRTERIALCSSITRATKRSRSVGSAHAISTRLPGE